MCVSQTAVWDMSLFFYLWCVACCSKGEWRWMGPLPSPLPLLIPISPCQSLGCHRHTCVCAHSDVRPHTYNGLYGPHLGDLCFMANKVLMEWAFRSPNETLKSPKPVRIWQTRLVVFCFFPPRKVWTQQRRDFKAALASLTIQHIYCVVVTILSFIHLHQWILYLNKRKQWSPEWEQYIGYSKNTGCLEKIDSNGNA